MSQYYSKFLLNTYLATPYFQAHAPAGYPLTSVLLTCRAFRRLPPNLRHLSGLAKRWAAKNGHPAAGNGIDRWYDGEGYELDPGTGGRLTDEEIAAQWVGVEPPGVAVADIPVPAGGFPDPDAWQPPAPDAEDDSDDGDKPTEAQILSDIADRGREYAARYYGVPADRLAGIGSDRELARAILERRAR